MEISLSELKDICGGRPTLPDKKYGWSVVILRNGFVFVGDLERRDGIGYLQGMQVRYWSKRDGGLPEFAAGGRREGDKLDVIIGVLEFPFGETNVIGVMPCGLNWLKQN